jgi:hypothetical protein
MQTRLSHNPELTQEDEFGISNLSEDSGDGVDLEREASVGLPDSRGLHDETKRHLFWLVHTNGGIGHFAGINRHFFNLANKDQEKFGSKNSKTRKKLTDLLGQWKTRILRDKTLTWIQVAEQLHIDLEDVLHKQQYLVEPSHLNPVSRTQPPQEGQQRKMPVPEVSQEWTQGSEFFRRH